MTTIEYKGYSIEVNLMTGKASVLNEHERDKPFVFPSLSKAKGFIDTCVLKGETSLFN